MTRHLSMLFTLICFLTTTCLADDAQEAVALLSDALKCPISPKIVDSNDTDITARMTTLSGIHIVNKYTGTEEYLQIETEKRISSGYQFMNRTVYRVPYSQLAYSSINFVNGRYGVVWLCDSDRGACTSVRFANVSCSPNTDNYCLDDLPYRMSSTARQAIELCDAETAGYAKLAIDTLIRHAKSNALQKPTP
jgi:hypothetical protein